MIHFVVRFDRAPQSSPLARALRQLGVPHRLFGAVAPQSYKYRVELLLRIYPALAWAAFKSGVRSLFSRGESAPSVVVVASDVEVLVFALLRLLPMTAKPRLVLMPFIFTRRNSPLLDKLRRRYYTFVLGRTSCAICHSHVEVSRYKIMFAGSRARFVFVPWGGYVPDATEIGSVGPGQASTTGRPLPGKPLIVSAGRSGRDYATLALATEEMNCHTIIICDDQQTLSAVLGKRNVELISKCFGLSYLKRLSSADIVAVPLLVDEISAGQMVIIQAMAFGRPLVVTQTSTTCDYVEHEVTALLVPMGDAGAMRAALKRLIDDPGLADRLGRNARASYLSRFSLEANCRHLIGAIQSTSEQAVEMRVG